MIILLHVCLLLKRCLNPAECISLADALLFATHWFLGDGAGDTIEGLCNSAGESDTQDPILFAQ